MSRITHFEIITPDPAKSAEFYRRAFGWQIDKWEGPVDYWLITTGEAGTPGIDGGFMVQSEPSNGTINTIQVDNIDAAIAKVKANGGEIIFEKMPIPGMGYQAYFKDPWGTMVGLHQADPKAGMS